MTYLLDGSKIKKVNKVISNDGLVCKINIGGHIKRAWAYLLFDTREDAETARIDQMMNTLSAIDEEIAEHKRDIECSKKAIKFLEIEKEEKIDKIRRLSE